MISHPYATWEDLLYYRIDGDWDINLESILLPKGIECLQYHGHHRHCSKNWRDLEVQDTVWIQVRVSIMALQTPHKPWCRSQDPHRESLSEKTTRDLKEAKNSRKGEAQREPDNCPSPGKQLDFWITFQEVFIFFFNKSPLKLMSWVGSVIKFRHSPPQPPSWCPLF